MPSHQLRGEDGEQRWEYLVEGGQHVLFQSTSMHNDKLLRVRKSWRQQQTAAEAVAIATRRRGMQYLFSPYVDMPEPISISFESLHRIFQIAKQCGRIPARRWKDWNNVGDHEATDLSSSTAIACSLVRNYHVPLTRSLGIDVCCWTIEMKPKAGYKAFSPLVSLDREYKFEQSRFRLTNSNSDYDPLDLFSGQYERIVYALRCLNSTNNNNNKNLHVRHHGEVLRSMKDSCWIPLAASILAQEPFLARLCTIQKLDILDADGAILLYRHLLHRLDETTLDALLDAPVQFQQEEEQQLPLHALLQASPTSTLLDLEDRKGLIEFCDIVESFRTEVLSSAHQAFRQRALDLMTTRLTIPAAVYLLQTWLLSLSMCDISFFISLCRTGDTSPQQQQHANNQLPIVSSATSPAIVERYQSSDGPGRLVASDGIVWEYEIKMIDFDPKPACKLKTRHLKEEQLDRLVGVRTEPLLQDMTKCKPKRT